MGMLPEESVQTVQPFLICVEMFGFACAHYYVFAAREWAPGYKRTVVGLMDSLAVGDFARDVRAVLARKGGPSESPTI